MWNAAFPTASGQWSQEMHWPSSLSTLVPATWPQDLPLVRLTTCGCSPLKIELLERVEHGQPVYVPPDPRFWKSLATRTVLTFLAVLASQPGCTVSQDFLSQALRPGRRANSLTEEDEDDRCLRRPENIVSLARTLLSPPALAHLRETDQRTVRQLLIRRITASQDSGPAYQLAPFPLIWLDVEMMESQARQAAVLEHFGESASSTWQAVSALGLQGSFLPHEPYSDWAQWRRARVHDLLWQSVQAQMKTLSQSENQEAGDEVSFRLLSACWQAQPTNEDAFRALAELLSKRERFHYAEECYTQLCEALAQEGRTPHERTEQVMEYVRAKKTQRRPSPLGRREEYAHSSSPPSFFADQQPVFSSDFPDEMAYGILEPNLERERVASLDPSRRDFLQSIIRTATAAATFLPHSTTVPDISYSFNPAQAMYSDEAIPNTLEHFATLTATCRLLSEGNELQTAERLLWSYLPRLETIAKRSFAHERAAAELTSQGYLLAASLAGHRNDLRARHHLSEQALLYGKLAQDRNLQMVALRQLAVTFDYLGHPEHVLRISQKTVPYLGDVSALLRACIYADISGASTQLQLQYEAEHYLAMAYEAFPEDTVHEPDYLSTICRYSTLVLCEGLHHLAFGHAQEAANVFARIDGLHPKRPLPERVRIDLLNCQGETSIALGERDQACTYLETSIQAALAIGSEKRLQEASLLLQLMQNVWPHELPVRRLAEMFT